MGKSAQTGLEDFSQLLSGIFYSEAEELKALAWQTESLPGEAVHARFENLVGVTGLSGALPFVETRKLAQQSIEGHVSLKSETFANFLSLNRSLYRSYMHQARALRLNLVPGLSQARVYQVTSEIAGMQAASFSLFLAQILSASGAGETIVIDADTENQFVFPLLALPEPPPVLTENLQKPSSFRNDLQKCIVKAAKNLSYVNMQATSLRPFADDEFARIVGHLDADFENIVIYSGRRKNTWLSANAEQNYAVTDGSFKSELAALVRHSGGLHTVLLAPGRDRYLPLLSEDFTRLPGDNQWIEIPAHLHVLRDTVQRLTSARRITLGGEQNLPGSIDIHFGMNLYFHYAREDEANADKILNRLQKKMRARYPGASFFSQRSALKAIDALPKRSATTLLDIAGRPNLVSLPQSTELRSLAVFPAGVIPPLQFDKIRIAGASATAPSWLAQHCARAGYTQILRAPRITLQNPNALAAVLEQVQP